MTTSTDNAQKTTKPKKAKGPLRLEAVVPATILTLLLALYFVMFFDGHMRRAIEYGGTQINGAEVNVGYLRTSFLRAELEMGGIQITDKNQPTRNIFQVGKIHFKMLWDALLRAKVVVDNASILDIQALTPRKKPGYVVPPSPPSTGPTALEKAQAQVLDQTRKKYNENFLGDVASVLGGTDYKEQLKTIEGNLKSDARIKELQKELDEKKKKWETRLKELPQGPEFKAYQDRIKALKFDIKNPAELARNIGEADKIRKEIETKVKLVDQTSKDVKSELNVYSQEFKNLEKMVQEDLADLQKRLKLPNVDPKEFSQQLFMQMIEQKLGSLAKYIAVARKYMPPQKTAAEKQAKREEQIIPPKRGQGVNYHFPVTTGYPMFWLKYAALSSELGQSEYSGNIKGEIKDLNTDPSFLKKPTLFLAKGDFPKQGISGFDAKITLDHTTDQARDSMDIAIAGFPVSEQVLSNSPDVKLAIASAKGSSVMNAVLVDEALTVDIKNNFGDIKYDLGAKNKMVQEIIDAILKGIPNVTLNAKVTGSLSNFNIGINSNLGDELAKGFQKQLQAKIDEAKAQLNKLVNERIGSEKAKLKEQMDKTLGPITKGLDEKKAEADKAVNDAKNQVEGQKNQGQGKQLEQEGKKLLKKFGIGG
ncbi:MAG: TIGR03545 family protein [Bdellovibrionales bacterium]|nr:TIGR03545 family protein [Bdellovibrionales bacterium]